MAKYLILIYGDEQQWAAMSPQELQELAQSAVCHAENSGEDHSR
jgi:hypothetical protein